jgi:hypothetical protein
MGMTEADLSKHTPEMQQYSPQQVLEVFRAASQGKNEPFANLRELFDAETKDGEDMSKCRSPLDRADAGIAT